jgi:hypothetical protein
VSFWQREGGGGWLREDEKLGFLGFLSFSNAPPQIFSALASKFSSLFIDKNIIVFQMLGETSVFDLKKKKQAISMSAQRENQ